MTQPQWSFETRQIHAGQTPDPTTGARALPIYQTTSYVFPDAGVAADRFALKDLGPIYTRIGNPTVEVVENRIAALEGGVGALLLASGQAAETYAILNIAEAGSHIVASPSLYGGTYNLLHYTLPRYGIETTFVSDPQDPQAWRDAVRPNTKAFYAETVPNPKQDVLDIETVAGIAHESGVPLIVDNTVATPYLIRPLEWGADIVVHSATKYLGGHGAAIGGVIVDGGTFDFGADPERYPSFNTPDPSYDGLVFARDLGKDGAFGVNLSYILRARVQLLRDLGAAISPFNAFLIAQGIETLSLRVERHVANAQKVAEWLEARDDVLSVTYAGLPSHPQYDLGRKYGPNGTGAVLAFEIAGGAAAGQAFVSALELHSNVANIGDVRSLVIHPASTTHSQLTPEEQAQSGVTPGLVRLSVGLEGIEDILADLDAGFRAAKGGLSTIVSRTTRTTSATSTGAGTGSTGPAPVGAPTSGTEVPARRTTTPRRTLPAAPPRASSAWRDGDPVGRRQFADLGPFGLEAGGRLPAVRLAYETWGTLAPDGSNAVLVLHALTGDSHVTGPAGPGHPTPGWWSTLVGPGAPIDTDRWFVVAPNVLGGCQGSTGPASAAPDGQPWGSRFPQVTVRDQVAAELRLADALGIDSWALVVGASMGGQRALEWAVTAPDRVRRLAAIATTAQTSGDQIASFHTQLTALTADPRFRGGDYYDAPDGEGPHVGLGLARQIAHQTYRSAAELDQRFGRIPQGGEEPLDGGRFAVQSYLDHHGDKLARRFDANTYAVLTRSMITHDLGRDRGGVEAALAGVTADTLVVAVDSDRLFLPEQSARIAAGIPGAGPVRTLRTPYGHDGFLIEHDQLGPLVHAHLARPER